MEQHPRGLAPVRSQNLGGFISPECTTAHLDYITLLLLHILLYRWVKNLILRHCTSATTETAIPRWEQDYRLQSVSKLGLFYEYLEMGKRGFSLGTEHLENKRPNNKSVHRGAPNYCLSAK